MLFTISSQASSVVGLVELVRVISELSSFFLLWLSVIRLVLPLRLHGDLAGALLKLLNIINVIVVAL